MKEAHKDIMHPPLFNLIKRQERKFFAQNIHAITTFENILKNDAYLFLRTYSSEGNYIFQNTKTPFENIIAATIIFLKSVLSEDKILDMKDYWRSRAHLDPTYIIPVHSYQFNGREGEDYLFSTSDTGGNLISLISSIIFEKKANFICDFNIRQKDSVFRNASCDMHRLMFPTGFEGKVKKDLSYIVFDDHFNTGSTAANLAGHISSQQGKVLGFQTLSLKPGIDSVYMKDETWLRLSNEKYYQHINKFWLNAFGFCLASMTDEEAQMLLKLMSQHGSSIVDFLVEYRKNPLPPTYQKPPWWNEKMKQTAIIALDEFGVEGRIVLLPSEKI